MKNTKSKPAPTPPTPPTAKTPPPEVSPTLMYRRADAPRDVADAVGVDEKTVRRWCGLSPKEYPAPHDRLPDGRLGLSVAEVRDWMRRSGRTGEVGRPEDPGDDAGDFWRRCGSVYRPDAEVLAALFTDFERDVVSGARTLTPTELAEYVEVNVKVRERLVGEQLDFIAPWLAGVGDAAEVRDRLRVALLEPLDYLVWRLSQMLDAQDGVERDDAGRIVPAKPPARAK